MLLYPTTSEELSLSYDMDGHEVTVKTINLNQNWKDRQLGELEGEHERFRAAGLSLFALSNEPSEDQIPLEQRLNERVTFLSDVPGEALDGFGLRDTRGAPWYDRLLVGASHGDIPMPATIVVRGDGTIGLIHRSNTVDDRPSADAVLDNALKLLK